MFRADLIKLLYLLLFGKPNESSKCGPEVAVTYYDLGDP